MLKDVIRGSLLIIDVQLGNGSLLKGKHTAVWLERDAVSCVQGADTALSTPAKAASTAHTQAYATLTSTRHDGDNGMC